MCFSRRGPGDSTRYLASNFLPQVAFELFSVHWIDITMLHIMHCDLHFYSVRFTFLFIVCFVYIIYSDWFIFCDVIFFINSLQKQACFP